MRAVLRFPAVLGLIVALAYGLLDGADSVWLLMLAVSGCLLAIVLWPRRDPVIPSFHRSVQRLGTLLMIGFVLTSAQLVRQQVLFGPSLVARVERVDGVQVIADPRRQNLVLRTLRGRVYDRGGTLLVSSVADDRGLVRRTYESAEAAYLVGYHSPLQFGNNNLELRYDDALGGKSSPGWLSLQRRLLHQPPRGLDLHLTLDLGLQRVAAEALADRKGAVVVLDTQTGAVLAMVSNPHADPAALVFDPAVPDWEGENRRLAATWRALTTDQRDPLLLRATQGLYTPGSIFKTVVLAALLDTGLATPETIFEDKGELRVDSHVIRELNRPNPPKNSYTLAESFRYSLNVVFAQAALQLGPERLADYTHRFGFDEDVPFDLPVARGQTANDPAFLQRPTGLADTGYGQGELLVTPLQMAMVAAAVANNGRMMQPYLVESVTTEDGRVVSQWRPTVWKTSISENTAKVVRSLMVSLVEQTLSPTVRIQNVRYGGKTGTAEVSAGDRTHAWFIAFGPEPDPRYAVAVVVEEGGKGGQVAAPIAKRVLERAILGR